MKPSLTKLFCMLITLALLLVPIATFAEEEQPPPAQVTIGSDEYSNFLFNISVLDPETLFLNNIAYKPDEACGGRIVMYTGDLMSAKGAAEVIAQYNANANANADSQSSVDPASLIFISRGSAKLVEMALPDPEIVARELEEMEFPEELISDSAKRLAQALAALEKTLSRSRDQIYTDKIASIRQLLDQIGSHFERNVADVYQLLYDIRAAIACEELPKSLLADETMTNLLTIYRDVLNKGGMDQNKIGFWENDAAWVAYAATQFKPRIAIGDIVTLSDGTGTVVPVETIDEYLYEPPMPPVSPPEVPM